MLTLCDAARKVCEGLDALSCLLMNVRRPDLSFTPPYLTLPISYCYLAHACIESTPALSTAALEIVHSLTAREVNAISLDDDMSRPASSMARNACLHLNSWRT